MKSRLRALVVVAKVELVAGQDEVPGIGQLDVQPISAGVWPAKRWRWRPSNSSTWSSWSACQLHVVDVVRHVGTEVLAGRDGVKRIAQLVAVDVHRDVGAAEELEPTGVVKVQVRQDDGADVLDAEAGRLERDVEVMLALVARDREELLHDRRLQLAKALRRPGVEEHRPCLGVLQERAESSPPPGAANPASVRTACSCRPPRAANPRRTQERPGQAEAASLPVLRSRVAPPARRPGGHLHDPRRPRHLHAPAVAREWALSRLAL